MNSKMSFRKSVWQIALPVTLQSLVQASFGVIDQMMTGQLGSVSVAAIGLGGKFASLYTVVVSAVATAAGIVFAQYIGKDDRNGVSRMFALNGWVMAAVAAVFTAVSTVLPGSVMSLYSGDAYTVEVAAEYLSIVGAGFVPQAFSLLISSLLRCRGKAGFPLFASVTAAVVNTGLNYLLIFGKGGFPALGVKGAAVATTAARLAECAMLIVFLAVCIMRSEFSLRFTKAGSKGEFGMLLGVLLPLLATEFLWGLGENVYAVIYGRIGTDDCAAMTLTYPVQSLTIGAMTGLASASGIIAGRLIGEGDPDGAYAAGKKFIRWGLIGSLALSGLLLLGSPFYVRLFNVGGDVRHMTRLILAVYAAVAPVKILNMIVGGGVLRSGGKTNYIMFIDIFGTWAVGVPLGLLASLVLHLPIHGVYFMLSMEECVRLAITLALFRRRVWISRL